MPSLAMTDVPDGREALPYKPEFHTLYRDHCTFVWRMLRRLGVPPANVADATQDVFVVIHRRLACLQSSEVARSWVYGIVARVARDHRRTLRRKGLSARTDPDTLVDPSSSNVHDQLEQREAVVLLDRLLETLSDKEREVLVLVELEQMTAAEIAEAIGTNVNTVYTRLRASRRNFERALTRYRAQTRGRP
jgi:RNA polymerase sigma-70 factor (ECF subfamily)